MMTNRRIIGFAGRKRSGKGMLAKAIKAKYPNTVILAVADSLKDLCCELLNITSEKLDRYKNEGTTINKKTDGRWVSIIHQETGIDDSLICNAIGGKTFTTVREVLQVIGTDLIRKYYPNWHVDKMAERIKTIPEDVIVVVDDVRFPNEKKVIEELGGRVFFMIRPNNFDVSNHPSEVALSFTDFNDDSVIINDLPQDDMEEMFISYYFENDEKTPILLENNPWYIDHMIDIETYDTVSNAERTSIIKKVIEFNKDKPQFKRNGIITFETSDNKALKWFSRYFLWYRYNSCGINTYVYYNPLTNEILKKYMG